MNGSFGILLGRGLAQARMYTYHISLLLQRYRFGHLLHSTPNSRAAAAPHEHEGIVMFLRFRFESNNPQKGSTPPYCAL